MFCPNCGAELQDGAKFCTKCGMAISGGTPQSASAETSGAESAQASASAPASAPAPAPITDSSPAQPGASYGNSPYGSTPQPQAGAPYGNAQQPNSPYGASQQQANPYGNVQQPVSPYGATQQPANPYGNAPQPGYGAPYPNAPYGAVPPTSAPKKNKVPIIIAAVVAIVALIAFLGTRFSSDLPYGGSEEQEADLYIANSTDGTNLYTFSTDSTTDTSYVYKIDPNKRATTVYAVTAADSYISQVAYGASGSTERLFVLVNNQSTQKSTILSMDTEGSDVKTIYDGESILRIGCVDGTFYYMTYDSTSDSSASFMDTFTIHSMDFDGENATDLAEIKCSSVVITQKRVYYSDDEGIHSCDFDGSNDKLLASESDNLYIDGFSNGKIVLTTSISASISEILDDGAYDLEVKTLDTNSGKLTDVATIEDQQFIYTSFVDDGKLFLTLSAVVDDEFGGQLISVDLSSGNVQTMRLTSSAQEGDESNFVNPIIWCDQDCFVYAYEDGQIWAATYDGKVTVLS